MEVFLKRAFKNMKENAKAKRNEQITEANERKTAAKARTEAAKK